MGEILNTAFPEQDHDAHIRIHMAFMKTPLVMTSPQVMGTFYAHIHGTCVTESDEEMVMQEIQSIISQAACSWQSGAIDPQAAQQQIMKVQTAGHAGSEELQMESLISLQMEKLHG